MFNDQLNGNISSRTILIENFIGLIISKKTHFKNIVGSVQKNVPIWEFQ